MTCILVLAFQTCWCLLGFFFNPTYVMQHYSPLRKTKLNFSKWTSDFFFFLKKIKSNISPAIYLIIFCQWCIKRGRNVENALKLYSNLQFKVMQYCYLAMTWGCLWLFWGPIFLLNYWLFSGSQKEDTRLMGTHHPQQWVTSSCQPSWARQLHLTPSTLLWNKQKVNYR